MVRETKDPNRIAEQLQTTRADVIDLMALTAAHVALTGDTRSVSSLESAYHYIGDALNNVNEFAESVEGESL